VTPAENYFSILTLSYLSADPTELTRDTIDQLSIFHQNWKSALFELEEAKYLESISLLEKPEAFLNQVFSFFQGLLYEKSEHLFGVQYPILDVYPFIHSRFASNNAARALKTYAMLSFLSHRQEENPIPEALQYASERFNFWFEQSDHERICRAFLFMHTLFLVIGPNGFNQKHLDFTTVIGQAFFMIDEFPEQACYMLPLSHYLLHRFVDFKLQVRGPLPEENQLSAGRILIDNPTRLYWT